MNFLRYCYYYRIEDNKDRAKKAPNLPNIAFSHNTCILSILGHEQNQVIKNVSGTNLYLNKDFSKTAHKPGNSHCYYFDIF